MRIKRTLATVAAAALATTGLVACSNESNDATETTAANGENVTVKIGTTEADQEAWTVFKQLAADNGIELDIVQFSDYSPVNEALAQGELDVNKFQHIKYLAEHNAASGNAARTFLEGPRPARRHRGPVRRHPERPVQPGPRHQRAGPGRSAYPQRQRR